MSEQREPGSRPDRWRRGSDAVPTHEQQPTDRVHQERHPNEPDPAEQERAADTGDDRQDLRDTIERFTAVVSGAADGVLEGLERYRLGDETEKAIHESGRMIREPTAEAQRQLDTSEARELSEDARGSAEAMRDKIGSGTHAARQEYEMRKVHLVDRAEDGQERLRARLEQAEYQVDRAQDKVREQAHQLRSKAEDVREASRRSRGAAAAVTGRMRDALTASIRSVGVAAGGYAAAGVVGTITLVLLSIGSVVGFNLLLGNPWGYFVTAGIYALGAVVIAAGARAGSGQQKEKASEQIGRARDEIDHVVAPLREDDGRRAAVRRSRAIGSEDHPPAREEDKAGRIAPQPSR